MFSGFHWPELIALLVIALIIFGPKRLPEIGTSLGKGIKEFRKATTEEHAVSDPAPSQIPATPPVEMHASEPQPAAAPQKDREAG